jgi:hypothetical protein
MVEPDHRNAEVFEFVRTDLKELARDVGEAKAQRTRDELVERGATAGHKHHDLDVAISILLHMGLFEEKDGRVGHAGNKLRWPLPSEQIASHARGRVPTMKHPLIDQAFPIVREVMRLREAGAGVQVEDTTRRERLASFHASADSGTGDKRMATTTRIFISHASGDANLAEALIKVIEAGLNVPDGAIRCTSVDGYKLEGGDDAPEVLRENLKSSPVVLGVLTKTSVASSYVLMELGAAWAYEKRAVPLIGPGATFKDLPGPFKDMHGLRMEHEPDMSGLVKTIGEATGFTQTNNMPKVVKALKVLAELATASGAPGVRPPPTFHSAPSAPPRARDPEAIGQYHRICGLKKLAPRSASPTVASETYP